jgi:hypothetical protein
VRITGRILETPCAELRHLRADGDALQGKINAAVKVLQRDDPGEDDHDARMGETPKGPAPTGAAADAAAANLQLPRSPALPRLLYPRRQRPQPRQRPDWRPYRLQRPPLRPRPRQPQRRQRQVPLLCSTHGRARLSTSGRHSIGPISSGCRSGWHSGSSGISSTRRSSLQRPLSEAATSNAAVAAAATAAAADALPLPVLPPQRPALGLPMLRLPRMRPRLPPLLMSLPRPPACCTSPAAAAPACSCIDKSSFEVMVRWERPGTAVA